MNKQEYEENEGHHIREDEHEPDESFQFWCDRVKEEYQRIAGFIPEPFDEEAYRDYYNDDYSPIATVYEDLSYA